MDWKISLDRYLTSPPEDRFDDFCEDILANKISDEFYGIHEKWLDEYDGQCNKWLNKLYSKNKTTIESAAIIERAFYLYKLEK